MKILFMCVANSARSQMAEGLARAILPSAIEIQSAGSEPSHVNPLAIQVLGEIGIDISRHTSKGVASLDTVGVSHVVTLCAEEVCPYFPGTVLRLHWPLPDPGKSGGGPTQALEDFRQVREQIKAKVVELASQLVTASARRLNGQG